MQEVPVEDEHGSARHPRQLLRDEASRAVVHHRRSGGLRIMACHETPPGKELPCVGWLANQLGPGNNLALRLAVMTGRVDGNVQTVGEQHERFEDTLP